LLIPPRLPVSEKDLPYRWQQECLAAINERDPELLKEKILAAELAIFERALQLNGSNDDAERGAMKHAARSLRVLMVNVLGYPG
jgi:hypothetical protein